MLIYKYSYFTLVSDTLNTHFDSLPSLAGGILPCLLCFAREEAEDVVSHAVPIEAMVGQSCCRGIS